MIKNIGDEVLFVADDLTTAADVALVLTARGADDQDEFPSVRAGLAYGEVVARLGDVLGPTVNIASRLTSIARPGTVLVDDGAHEPLSGDDSPFGFRKLRRTSVKGYDHLQPWALRRSGRCDKAADTPVGAYERNRLCPLRCAADTHHIEEDTCTHRTSCGASLS